MIGVRQMIIVREFMSKKMNLVIQTLKSQFTQISIEIKLNQTHMKS